MVQYLKDHDLVNTFISRKYIEDAMEVGNRMLVIYVVSPTEVTHAYWTKSAGSDKPLFETVSIHVQEKAGRKKRHNLEFFMGTAINFLVMNEVGEDEVSLATRACMAVEQERKIPFGENGEERELMFMDERPSPGA